MITNIELLQHRYYSDWKRDDGCRNGPYCKFCQVVNYSPLKEFHMPDCERLEYLKHYYNVKIRKAQKAYRNLIVNGVEFTRSDVYGWWINKQEFAVLIKAAFEKEGKQ